MAERTRAERIHAERVYPARSYDVVGIGNAIVDIIARCDDAFLSKHDLAKGFMRLIPAGEAGRLYEVMGPVSSAAFSATTSARSASPTTPRLPMRASRLPAASSS